MAGSRHQQATQYGRKRLYVGGSSDLQDCSHLSSHCLLTSVRVLLLLFGTLSLL